MKLRNCMLLLTLLTLLVAPLAFAAQDTQMQVRVYFGNRAQLLALIELHPDIVYRGKDFVDVITDEPELKEIRGLGLKTEITHPDIVSFYQSRLANKEMGGYKTLDEINSYVDQIIADHPDIVSSKVSLGLSIEGRDIWAVKISDNPEVDEDEPEVLFTAAIHAREVITPEIVLYFMDYLTNNYGTDPEATFLVDNREMWFVPVINVDGYRYNQTEHPNGAGLWRKNRRDNGDGTWGVDLNRNFGYEWGYDNSGSSSSSSEETYRGTGPFSEPESQALRDFIQSHQFEITVSYHSYSNLILWPWGYDRVYTDDETLFRSIGDSLTFFNDYGPEVSWGLYKVNGSTDDWGYGEQITKNKNYAFTVESGSPTDGFWPDPSRIPEMVAENLEPNKIFADLAENVYKIYPPSVPTMIIDDSVLASEYTVSWTPDDTINPPVQYELEELKNNIEITDMGNNFDNFDRKGFSITSSSYHSGSTGFYSGAGDNIYYYIQTKTPYPVGTSDVLTFWTSYDIETNWDYAYVEVSTDGVNFASIPGDITTNYNPNGSNRGNGITGSHGWIQAHFDLSDYSGQDLYIRFSYKTDQYVTNPGIYIDDIYPVYGFTYASVLASDIADTSYTITGHSSGRYFYRVRAKDAEDQLSVYAVPKPVTIYSNFTCGDVNGDSNVDVLDIIYLINFKFKGGPEPVIMDAANVDGNGTVDVLDIIYFIAFKFKDGPDLNCP